MSRATGVSRRGFLGAAGVMGGGLAAGGGCARVAGLAGSGGDVEVGPAEDLMREHGVLRRVLLVYDELAARLSEGKECPADALAGSADLIRRFVEDYHERLEEEHIFPLFEKTGPLAGLVRVLREQHEAGRRLTAALRARATAAALAKPEERKLAAGELRRFTRMYRPHAAQEDTVLFPAFHALLSERDYDRLGDAFEAKERELFGPQGFEGKVREVAAIEAKMGLADLAQFTP